VAERRTSDTLRPIKDLLDAGLERLEALYERGETITGLPTGFVDLDERLSGLQKSSLVIVGARPSMGKTAFALGMAAHAAMEVRQPVLFFSLEMSHAEITQRLLVSESRVDSNRIRNGRLLDTDWPKISHAISRLGEAPLFIDDNANLTVMEVRAKARRLKARQGGLGLVVVDYLQLMSGRQSAENRQVEVSEISRGLKILARELDVPVVALSQLSRNLEARSDKRPVLADLRESGCMPASTRLLRADTGQEVTLGELVLSQEQPLVWSLDDHSWKLVPRRLAKTFPSGIKPVYRLRLRSGYEVEATANHPFRTVNGWKRLDGLGVGDFLATPREVRDPVGRVGERWSEDELVLLAHGLRSHNKFIPESIFGLDSARIALFLRHLWATDGSITVGRNQRGSILRIYYATTSSRLADGVKRALLRLGIRSSLAPTSKVGHRICWHVTITGRPNLERFLTEVGCHGARGQAVPAALAALATQQPNPNVDLVPRARLAPIAEVVDDQQLAALADSDVFWDEITEITPAGLQPTFDATVEGTHNFVANGVIAHNSLEQDADVVMFLYRDEVYNPESPDRGTAEVIVSKHRNGPTGKAQLAFLDHHTRFANMARM
jgi:replicative DNA helicase